MLIRALTAEVHFIEKCGRKAELIIFIVDVVNLQEA